MTSSSAGTPVAVRPIRGPATARRPPAVVTRLSRAKAQPPRNGGKSCDRRAGRPDWPPMTRSPAAAQRPGPARRRASDIGSPLTTAIIPITTAARHRSGTSTQYAGTQLFVRVLESQACQFLFSSSTVLSPAIDRVLRSLVCSTAYRSRLPTRVFAGDTFTGPSCVFNRFCHVRRSRQAF